MATGTYSILLLCLSVIIATLINTAVADDIVYVTVTTTIGIMKAKTVQATPTAPSPASYTSLDDFKKTVLQVSNDYRKAHDAEPLVWNDTLTKYARNWAETCIWKHSHGPYGENLAFGFSNASATVAAWGDEGQLYNFQKPTGFTEKTGHFTQLVWRSTAEAGCAAINCGYSDNNKERRDTHHIGRNLQSRAADGTMRAQGWYVVCEYTPAGNVVGRHKRYFRLNVRPRKSSVSSTSASGSHSSKAETAGNVDSTVCMTLMALGTVAVGMGLYT